ncbi:MAG TPA: MarR family transcriptional regulator [Candidatus Dormibacteraeota bacterium]
MADTVEALMDRLGAQRPELDISSMAVGGRIGRVALHLGKIRDAVFAPHKIAAGEDDVLAALWREGPPYELSPGRLLASVTISSGGMTGRIDRLERAHLVARRPDPDDRRGVLVRLTDVGATLTGQLIERYLEEQKRYLTVLTPAELGRLEVLLRKLTVAAERWTAESGLVAAGKATTRRRPVRPRTAHTPGLADGSVSR